MGAVIKITSDDRTQSSPSKNVVQHENVPEVSVQLKEVCNFTINKVEGGRYKLFLVSDISHPPLYRLMQVDAKDEPEDQDDDEEDDDEKEDHWRR